MAIYYRDHCLMFRQVKAVFTTEDEGRCPFPAPSSSKPNRIPRSSVEENRYQHMKTLMFSSAW
jgi:hypothetical protein